MITSNTPSLSRSLAASATLIYLVSILAKLLPDRRFESAQDFPQPPPSTHSTHTKYQPTLDFYQPTATEDWVDGFLKSQNDHENLFEELPGTFVGMATTLSPSEKTQFLEDPRTFSDGQDLLEIRGGEGLSTPASSLKNDYSQSYNGMQQGFPRTHSNRSSLRSHQILEPLYGTSLSAYESTASLSQNGQYYFPTPPLSTHVPSFFDNSDLGGRTQSSGAVQTPQRLQFGSDARFEGPGFMAPQEQETEEALVQRRIEHLECLKPDPSPASTNPPSPMLQKRKHSQIQYPNSQASLRHQPLSQDLGPPQTFEDYGDSDPTPKRRRKAPLDEDPDFQALSTPVRTQSKRSKPSTSKKPTPVRQNYAPTSRTDSARQRQASIKNNRQVLTDEQKKTNHIISEQKRRDLIKRGYEGIQVLVPALKDHKTSKGGMLESAADWLDDILGCNETLRQQLAGIKGGGRNGFA